MPINMDSFEVRGVEDFLRATSNELFHNRGWQARLLCWKQSRGFWEQLLSPASLNMRAVWERNSCFPHRTMSSTQQEHVSQPGETGCLSVMGHSRMTAAICVGWSLTYGDKWKHRKEKAKLLRSVFYVVFLCSDTTLMIIKNIFYIYTDTSLCCDRLVWDK